MKIQNKPVCQLFHNSTILFCKTVRQGNIRNIGKDEQNINFVYFDNEKRPPVIRFYVYLIKVRKPNNLVIIFQNRTNTNILKNIYQYLIPSYMNKFNLTPAPYLFPNLLQPPRNTSRIWDGATCKWYHNNEKIGDVVSSSLSKIKQKIDNFYLFQIIPKNFFLTSQTFERKGSYLF